MSDQLQTKRPQPVLLTLHYNFLRQMFIGRRLHEFSGVTDGIILNDLLYAGYITLDTHGVTATETGKQAWEVWRNHQLDLEEQS